ncbi:MAG: TolC family protein [Spirochaetia bacterium]|nr:TolC family protein [Spirochaetia bacterium]
MLFISRAEADDLNLRQAIDIGIKNNLNLEFAQKENRLALKNVHMKYREYLPSVNVGYSLSDTVSYYADDTHSRQINVGIKQMIYDKGTLRASIKIEKERLALEAKKNKQDREAFIFSVIDNYKNVLELEKELEITRQARSVVAQQVEIGLLERDIGELTQFDYIELELALADMDIQILKITHKLTQSHLDFATVMNMRPDEIPPLSGELNYLYNGCLSGSENYYTELALNNSLELKEIEFAKHKAASEYSILKKKYLPEVSLSCNASVYDDSFPLSEKSFSVVLDLDFSTPGLPSTISAGLGKNSSDQRYRTFSTDVDIMGNSDMLYSEAGGKVAYDKARWNCEKYARECRSQVIERYRNILVLVENIDNARKRIELEEKKVSIEELKVQLGLEKRIDYVESQMELAQNRIQIFRAISDLYSQETALMSLCGQTGAEFSGEKLIQRSGL